MTASPHRREHTALPPTWLCRACAHPWPCGEARVTLLRQYGHDRAGLLVYLASLMAVAQEQLTDLDCGNAPRLEDRFLTWARSR
ncbi:flavin reductase [Micromonospora sp. PLK6-60]|uniref:flavin reductase n=1 Tax=Micromonospora sp. PLK6-60 TaxID=2873383 RepID=UPI001CA6AA4D|nr:flavin reductase [Micromonospora sp. PLK6-60]MBY8872702.1 flavin reductase [Micromonospora sp. PLK6-60]